MNHWRSSLFCTAAFLLASQPAFALQQPTPGKEDSRVGYVNYSPNQVVQIWTAPGAILEVQFAADEAVPEGNVAVTDGSRLVVKARGNFLYLKFKGCMVPEPLLVTTKTATGQLRPYRFEVETKGSDCSDQPPPSPQAKTVSDDGKDGPAPKPQHGNLKFVQEGGLAAGADVFYSVVFKYPLDEQAKRMAAWRERQAREEKAAATRMLQQQASEGTFGNHQQGTWNFKYVAQGDITLTPHQVRDDGHSTVFIFPNMQRIPALFRLNPDGTEATANFSVHRGDSDGDIIMAEGTAQEWRLRDGSTVMNIRNFAYSLSGSTPATGTISPFVTRELKGDVDER